MSKYADFDRDTAGMKALFERVDGLCRDFAKTVSVRGPEDAAAYFRLYDAAITARATLSAMICSAETIGTHGSAFVDRRPGSGTGARTTRTLTVQDRGTVRSFISPVSEMPDPELWFETLLERSRKTAEARGKTPRPQQ